MSKVEKTELLTLHPTSLKSIRKKTVRRIERLREEEFEREADETSDNDLATFSDGEDILPIRIPSFSTLKRIEKDW